MAAVGASILRRKLRGNACCVVRRRSRRSLQAITPVASYGTTQRILGQPLCRTGSSTCVSLEAGMSGQRFPGERRTVCILGIESSCDDSGVAIIDSTRSEDKKVLAHVVSSQFSVHAPYAGVVPTLAARSHAENLPLVLEEAVKQSELPNGLHDIDAIAVTGGPGLALCLKIGFISASLLAQRLQVPFLVINHLEAHALVPRLLDPTLKFPFLVLLVSGGHTMTVLAKGVDDYEIIGSTADDSVGEAFDKVARVLQLGYHQLHGPRGYKGDPEQREEPITGHYGQVLEELALEGDERRFRLPIPLRGKKTPGFSYSGLKTAVLYTAREQNVFDRTVAADLAASFQRVATCHLEDRVKLALEHCDPVNALVVCGGVSANSYIRGKLAVLAESQGIRAAFPAPSHCTDNGAMVAWAGVERWNMGGKAMAESATSTDFSPRWSLGSEREQRNEPGADLLETVAPHGHSRVGDNPLEGLRPYLQRLVSPLRSYNSAAPRR